MELNKEDMISNDSCCNVSTTFELVKDKYLRICQCIPIVNLTLEILTTPKNIFIPITSHTLPNNLNIFHDLLQHLYTTFFSQTLLHSSYNPNLQILSSTPKNARSHLILQSIFYSFEFTFQTHSIVLFYNHFPQPQSYLVEQNFMH